MTSSWKPLILTLAITGALVVACTDDEPSPGEGLRNLAAAGQAGRAGSGGAGAGSGGADAGSGGAEAGSGGADAGSGGAATAGAGDGGSAGGGNGAGDGGAAGGGAGGQSNVTCEDLSPKACHTSGLNCCQFNGWMWVVNDAEQCVLFHTADYRACAMYAGPSAGTCIMYNLGACYRRQMGATTEWIENKGMFAKGTLDPSWELVNYTEGGCQSLVNLWDMPPCAAGSGG